MRIRIVGPLVVLVCVSSVPAFAAPCDQLAALALKDAAVTSARLVSAGDFVPPSDSEGNATNRNAFKNLPAFCRVAATLKPSSDSDIKVEIWLPASGWNGKFQAVGNGGGPASSATPQWRPRYGPGMPLRPRIRGTSAAAAHSRSVIRRN